MRLKWKPIPDTWDHGCKDQLSLCLRAEALAFWQRDLKELKFCLKIAMCFV